jgi:hypothetical protein
VPTAQLQLGPSADATNADLPPSPRPALGSQPHAMERNSTGARHSGGDARCSKMAVSLKRVSEALGHSGGSGVSAGVSPRGPGGTVGTGEDKTAPSVGLVTAYWGKKAGALSDEQARRSHARRSHARRTRTPHTRRPHTRTPHTRHTHHTPHTHTAHTRATHARRTYAPHSASRRISGPGAHALTAARPSHTRRLADTVRRSATFT